jgi:hypothetical protein
MVVVKEHTKEIRGYAFQRCPKLRVLKIGSGLNRIGMLVFADCKSLEKSQ